MTAGAETGKINLTKLEPTKLSANKNNNSGKKGKVWDGSFYLIREKFDLKTKVLKRPGKKRLRKLLQYYRAERPLISGLYTFDNRVTPPQI